MNPYPDRINELHEFLYVAYGQKDQQATEILLACLLDPEVTRNRRPWLIVETDYPNRDLTDAWFTFGMNESLVGARHLSVPRVQRSQMSEDILQTWLALRRTVAPGVFVESEWRKLSIRGRNQAMNQMTGSYGVLLSQCIHLRVEHPKGRQAARPQDEQTTVRSELERLARRCLDNSHRAAGIRPLTGAIPKSMFYWCELLQRLSGSLTDWEALISNLVGVARALTALRYDEQPIDWQAVERLMRDSIPYCTDWILRQVGKTASRGLKAMDLLRQSGSMYNTQLVREVKRLRDQNVLSGAGSFGRNDPYAYHPWRYTIGHPDYLTLIDRDKRILI